MKTRYRNSCKIFCVILAIAYFVFGSSSALADQYECEEIKNILVTSPDENMVDYVCVAAERTFKFLETYQLRPNRPIKLDIIDKVVNHGGYMALGSYDRQRDQISIMSLPAVLRTADTPLMYDMPFDEEHYFGAIAHEISHAIFTQNAIALDEKWNNAAQEYLAHATQLGVLSKQRRDEIIAQAGTKAWETGDEISVTYMAFNPTGFAVKSYLHLTQMEDPQKFIQILLNHKWLYVSVP